MIWGIGILRKFAKLSEAPKQPGECQCPFAKL
jgi:hypothetical protein